MNPVDINPYYFQVININLRNDYKQKDQNINCYKSKNSENISKHLYSHSQEIRNNLKTYKITENKKVINSNQVNFIKYSVN